MCDVCGVSVTMSAEAARIDAVNGCVRADETATVGVP